jgi:GH25 family lysozyme M1 (1,4-beta-N-acetylmuramidase)
MASAVKQKKHMGILSAAAVLLIVAAVVLLIAANAAPRHTPSHYDFGKDEALGIDISEHNGDIDWDKLKSKVDFVFIRVGYMGYDTGDILKDKNAKKNMNGAEKAGIPYGVYIYSQAIDEKEARKEADFVLKAIKHRNPSLPVIIDFEYPTDANGNHMGRLYNAHLDAQANNKIINAFFDRVDEKGYLYGVYASSSVAYRKMNIKKLPPQALLWIADYNGEVTYNVNYDVWQFTSTGKCKGVESKNVDFNYWYGSRR